MQQSNWELPAFIGLAEAGWSGRPLAVRSCSRGAHHLFGQERKTTLKRDYEHEPKSAWSLFSEIKTDFVFSKTLPQFFFLLIIIKGDVCVCSSVFLGKDKSTDSVHLCVCMSVLQPEALPEALLGSSFVCLRIRHAITGPQKANGTSITSAPVWATTASTVTVVAIKQILERKLGQKHFWELKASPSWDAWGNLRYLIGKISML